MKTISLCDGEFASHWSLTDFYPESEKRLREALASGGDFDTEWFGCKKEINYARYVKENGKFTVSVSVHMDDLYEDENDLIYDAYWDVFGEEDGLSEEDVNKILEAAYSVMIDDRTEISAEIPIDSSFEYLVRKTDELEEEAEQNNSLMYDALKRIVENCCGKHGE